MIDSSNVPFVLPSAEMLRRYDAILRAHLDDTAYGFFSLLNNPQRVLRSLELFLAYAAVDPPLVLDIGAGAFTLAFLLEHSREWDIISIDHHPGYAPLFHDLTRSGLLRRTRFVVADVRSCAFRDGAFGAIIAHDVLYEPALDLGPLIPRFAKWLAPGGTLYMDVWDARLRWLWKLAGHDRGFRRYDLARVRQSLQQAGITVTTEAPYFGSGSVMLQTVRRVLWASTGLSNTRHFIGHMGQQAGDGAKIGGCRAGSNR